MWRACYTIIDTARRIIKERKKEFELKAIAAFVVWAGGLKAAVMLMIGFTSWQEKGQEIAKRCFGVFGFLQGIEAVLDACPGIKTTMKKLKQYLGV